MLQTKLLFLSRQNVQITLIPLITTLEIMETVHKSILELTLDHETFTQKKVYLSRFACIQHALSCTYHLLIYAAKHQWVPHEQQWLLGDLWEVAWDIATTCCRTDEEYELEDAREHARDLLSNPAELRRLGFMVLREKEA